MQQYVSQPGARRLLCAVARSFVSAICGSLDSVVCLVRFLVDPACSHVFTHRFVCVCVFVHDARTLLLANFLLGPLAL